MHRMMMVAIGALSLVGCTASRSAVQAGTGGSEASAMCPLGVPGTTVSEQDVAGGGALVFTTTQGDVMELRRRVAEMADMHNAHVARLHQLEQQGTGGSGPGPMEVPNAHARVEDIEGGARILYTPEDPARLPDLRQQLVRHASEMASGTCPMMKMHRHERKMEQRY